METPKEKGDLLDAGITAQREATRRSGALAKSEIADFKPVTFEGLRDAQPAKENLVIPVRIKDTIQHWECTYPTLQDIISTGGHLFHDEIQTDTETEKTDTETEKTDTETETEKVVQSLNAEKLEEHQLFLIQRISVNPKLTLEQVKQIDLELVQYVWQEVMIVYYAGENDAQSFRPLDATE